MIHYRKYQQSDFNDLRQLIEELTDYIVSIDPLKRCRRLPAYSGNYTKKTLANVKKNKGSIIFATDKSKIVGAIVGIIEKQTKFDLLECVLTKGGRILELYVKKEYRKRGIGKKLVQEMEKYFISKKCTVIKVDVFAPNTKAHNFYEQQEYRNRAVDMLKIIRK